MLPMRLQTGRGLAFVLSIFTVWLLFTEAGDRPGPAPYASSLAGLYAIADSPLPAQGDDLLARVRAMGEEPYAWDMTRWIREENWDVLTPARSDAGAGAALPAADDLPAAADGHVRSRQRARGVFHDGTGWVTGWRAVNYIPSGVHAPLAGVAPGVYIRLPERYMRNATGAFDLAIYEANLDRLAAAMRVPSGGAAAGHYVGMATNEPVRAAEHPVGTEYLQALHYVDVQADGRHGNVSRFPGLRAARVMEIRYARKLGAHAAPLAGGAVQSDSVAYAPFAAQGDGSGWLRAGWIEDAGGHLRRQTAQELARCDTCHARQVDDMAVGLARALPEARDGTFTLARQLPEAQGWRETDALAYRADPRASVLRVPGESSVPAALAFPERHAFADYLARALAPGFPDRLPIAVEAYFARTLRSNAGYAADWPGLDPSAPQAEAQARATRDSLLRAYLARAGHVRADGRVDADLLYPPAAEALANARRHRLAVVAQATQSNPGSRLVTAAVGRTAP